MKFTVAGFQQQAFIDLGLDTKDIFILGYLRDFIASNSMYSEIVDGDKYYWVEYTALIDELPILELNTVSIGRRFKKYEEIGVCKKYVKKKGGTYTFITPGDNFKKLFDYTNRETNDKKTPYKREKALDSKVQCFVDHCPEKSSTTVLKSTVPLSSKVQPNNPSTKNPSTKNPIRESRNINNEKSENDKCNSLSFVNEVVDYLNKKVGSNYRYSNKDTSNKISKLIKAGYGFKDFKAVIDKKTKEWTGIVHMEPQLTPWVLFGDKFEKYLEQREIVNIENMNSSGFNNFQPRDMYSNDEDMDNLEKKLLGWQR